MPRLILLHINEETGEFFLSPTTKRKKGFHTEGLHTPYKARSMAKTILGQKAKEVEI